MQIFIQKSGIHMLSVLKKQIEKNTLTILGNIKENLLVNKSKS